MTFTARLLMTILLIVIVTTAATLSIAQRQNRAIYRAVVDQLLDSWAAVFEREHEARHAFAAEQAERVAESVRLYAALEAGDPDVYKVADDELRGGEFAFFRIVDARGALIPPPADGRAGAVDLRLDASALAPRDTAPDGVQLGFVEARRAGASGPDAGSATYRVLAAPLRNFDRHVGTLVLGQRVAVLDAGAAEATGTRGLHSALWLDGRLTGGDVPLGSRAALTRALGAAPDLREGQFRVLDTTFRYRRSPLNPGSGYPPAELVSIFSMAGFEAQQTALTGRIALLGLVASIAAGLIALALSHQLARPVGALVAATREIRAGNYAQRLMPSSIREMRTLAESFNEMSEGLALKDKYHSVLQQVADPEVAEGLIAGRVKLGGELRDVTVMFCDIRQYTALTVGRDPESVILLLNHHMSAMTRVVQAHRGVINQFAGDAIMALFGAPRSYGDDTLRAVRCARALVRERDRLNRSAAIPLRIGIGIASGPMVAGCIGAENRSDYTVVGERVNLAARLSGAASADEILVDDTTRARVEPEFDAEPLAPLRLKGFTDPVPAYRIRLDRSAAA